MPNWCSNTVTFKHADTDQIRKVVDGYNEGKLLSAFFPCPQELLDGGAPAQGRIAESNLEKHGATDWYDWCVSNWGTKWDVGSGDGYEDVEYTDGQTEITLSFDSAWAPPLTWYNEMADEHGFEIEAYYLEEGMGFCGKWTNEDWDSDGYEFAGKDAEWVEQNIPKDIVEHWDILGLLDMYGDDDEEDGDDAVNLDDQQDG